MSLPYAVLMSVHIASKLAYIQALQPWVRHLPNSTVVITRDIFLTTVTSISMWQKWLMETSQSITGQIHGCQYYLSSTRNHPASYTHTQAVCTHILSLSLLHILIFFIVNFLKIRMAGSSGTSDQL